MGNNFLQPMSLDSHMTPCESKRFPQKQFTCSSQAENGNPAAASLHDIFTC
jgi:hypothetical protein